MATLVRAGRYEILGELGRGAMGIVYEATDPVIGRTVAVKTIRLSEEGTGLSRPELLTRFQTEARAAGLLTHPNIVVVYDAGEENGLYYITMELVQGKSVQALLDDGHNFPVPRILRIMEQTCNALQYAHERKIVHRDVKPANIMLTADDTVKITDFGTAKILQFGTAQQTTHVMGTPSYMSPEQVKGRPVDGRSDIFSLGVMLYELVTGEKPFPGQSITTVIYKIVNEEPIPPRQLNPSLHPGLNDIVLRALAKDPDVRYQSCREMLEDLRNYRSLGNGAHNPDATMISPRPPATLPLGVGAMPRGLHADDPAMATARALQANGATPGQTPVVRRTGPLTPPPEPKKKNRIGTFLAALLLLGVIVYGVKRLQPEFEAARVGSLKAQATETLPAATPVQPPAQPPITTLGASDASAEKDKNASAAPADAQGTPTANTAAANSPANTQPDPATQPAAEKAVPDSVAASPATNSAKQPATTPEATAPAPAVSNLSAAAADYKHKIELAAKDQGFHSRLSVTGTGNALTLTGKLRPAEHAAMLHFMRNAPKNVQIVDDIQYDDSPVPTSASGDNGTHPVPGRGKSAVHIVTNIIGATATLFGPAGRALMVCQTPCSFNNLVPDDYSLQVLKEGYQPVQTALELKAGETSDKKITLEPTVKGILVTSKPAGADIFINGAKQSGQTPVTLPLPPGQYDLVLRVPGYEAYAEKVQVKDTVQTTLDVELKQHSMPHVAWAQVDSIPRGAAILVDGVETGQVSPARVQIPAGSHTVALRLNGFQLARRGVQVSEGGTVTVNETLKLK